MLVIEIHQQINKQRNKPYTRFLGLTKIKVTSPSLFFTSLGKNH